MLGYAQALSTFPLPPCHGGAMLRVDGGTGRGVSTTGHVRWRTSVRGRCEGHRRKASEPSGSCCVSARSPDTVLIGPFIADFACLERRVVIEVDGSSHDNPLRRQQDAERDAWIAAQRFRVLRLEDGEVLENPEAALDRIRAFFGVTTSSECTTPTPTLPHRGGGG